MPESKRRLTTFFVAIAVLIATPLAVVAADAFDDVPDDNVHHGDITWLADNGITAGCNPPDNTEFCPGDPVLRQQMASFMRRLAERQVVDAASAVEAENADMLDGQDSTSYQTVVAAANCSIDDTAEATSCLPASGGALPNQTTEEVLSLNVDAPANGTLVMDVYTYGNATYWLTVDETCTAFDVDSPESLYGQLVNGFIIGTLGETAVASGTIATQVNSGDHLLRLCSLYPDNDDEGLVINASVTTQWTAGGSIDLQSTSPSGEVPADLPLLSG